MFTRLKSCSRFLSRSSAASRRKRFATSLLAETLETRELLTALEPGAAVAAASTTPEYADGVLTLPGSSSDSFTLSFDLTARLALYKNEMGFFLASDAAGTVNGLQPGDEGYAAAAFQDDSLEVVLARLDPVGTKAEVTLAGGSHIVFYIVQDSTTEELLAKNPENSPGIRPRAFFSVAEPNVGGASQVRVTGDGETGYSFAWEDLSTGGNGDFNDLMYDMSITPHQPPEPPAPPRDTLGVFRNGKWYLDSSGNGTWGNDDTTNPGNFVIPHLDAYQELYDTEGRPLVGDWDGDGIDNIGFHIGNQFYLDVNGNGAWDGNSAGDALYFFGGVTDEPVVGDWNGDGADNIGVKSGHRFELDLSGDGIWQGPNHGDALFLFGRRDGDLAVIGDWNGDGTDDIGVKRGHRWYLDSTGDGRWNEGDQWHAYGAATDVALVGDWDGDGIDNIGVRRGFRFLLDQNGDGVWNGRAAGDHLYGFGLETDVPLIGIWQ